MKIDENHWLEGVPRIAIPGGSPMENRVYLVMHFTGGWNAKNSIEDWKRKNDGVLAHIVIDRNGSLVQCRATNRTAGHAGQSRWKDRKTGKVWTGLNSCSIGIELCNCGDLDRSVYPVTANVGDLRLYNTPIPRLHAKHKNGGPMEDWETFPEAQYNSALAVAAALCERYNLDDVLGHDEIAPDRKNDPGPAWPMERFRAALGYGANGRK